MYFPTPPGYIQTPLLEDWLNGLGNEEAARMRGKIAGDAPLNTIGTIEDVGEVAAFLLSDASKFVSGSVIQVDGGLLCGYK